MELKVMFVWDVYGYDAISLLTKVSTYRRNVGISKLVGEGLLDE